MNYVVIVSRTGEASVALHSSYIAAAEHSRNVTQGAQREHAPVHVMIAQVMQSSIVKPDGAVEVIVDANEMPRSIPLVLSSN